MLQEAVGVDKLSAEWTPLNPSGMLSNLDLDDSLSDGPRQGICLDCEQLCPTRVNLNVTYAAPTAV
jgi:hypothetical protein